MIHKQYSSSIEAVLDLLYHEVILCQECGIHMTAEIIKVTLLKNKKNVFADEKRFFHIYLKQLIQKAKDEQFLKAHTDTEELTQLLLRHTRGIGYDWVSHQGSYNLEETIHKDIKLLLNNFLQDGHQFL